MSDFAWSARISTALPVAGEAVADLLAPVRRCGFDAVELDCRQLSEMAETKRLELREALIRANLQAAAIAATRGSGEGWRPEGLQQAFDLARLFGAGCVVTCAPPSEEDAAVDEGRLADWLLTAAALAEASECLLLLENRPQTWADTSPHLSRCLRLAESPWVGLAFDPAGFAAMREHPFLVSFMASGLKTRLRLLRVADAVFEGGAPVRLNDGNAEVKELVSAVLARSFDGIFSVCSPEPDAGAEQIERAMADFMMTLESLGVTRSEPIPGWAE